MPETVGLPSPLQRGLKATLSYLKAPFGSRWLSPLSWHTPERQSQGLVIVLPGIEGISSINHSLVHGLVDAQLPYAMYLHDWTMGLKPAMINLWLPGRTARAAAAVAELITDHRSQYPGTPVHLVGHSGGAALIPYVLNELPPDQRITSGVMIAPALSPVFDLSAALNKVEQRLVNVHSRLDWYFLGVGTSVVGTLDRRFGHAAGNSGFRWPSSAEPERHTLYRQRLVELRYRISMLRDWHYGGHLSCLNRVFVERHISPLLGLPDNSAPASVPDSLPTSLPDCVPNEVVLAKQQAVA